MCGEGAPPATAPPAPGDDELPPQRNLRWLCHVGERMARNVGALPPSARMVALAGTWRAERDPVRLIAERHPEQQYLAYFREKRAPPVAALSDGAAAATAGAGSGPPSPGGLPDVTYAEAFAAMEAYERKTHRQHEDHRTLGAQRASEMDAVRFGKGVARLVKAEAKAAAQLVEREDAIFKAIRRKQVVFMELEARARIRRESMYMPPDLIAALMHHLQHREIVIRSQTDQEEMGAWRTLCRRLRKDDAMDESAATLCVESEAHARATLRLEETRHYDMLTAWRTLQRLVILNSPDAREKKAAAATAGARRTFQTISAYSAAYA